MLIEIWERLHGYDKWVQTEATIESCEETSYETRNGVVHLSDDVMLWTDANGERHRAPFSAREGSSLYELIEGSTFTIRYNPSDPETRAGTANSDRGLGGSSARPQP